MEIAQADCYKEGFDQCVLRHSCQWFCKHFGLLLFSIYTLSDLGNSSKLIGQLSRTMTLYSPRQAVNIKQNKIAVVKWVFCQSFIVKPFLKYTNIQVLITFKARKDFMAFKQRDLLRSGLLQLTFVRSKLCLPLQRETRSLCHCFVISGFYHKTNFAYKQKLIYRGKKKANIFGNCTCQQVNKAINNAHLDHSHC